MPCIPRVHVIHVSSLYPKSVHFVDTRKRRVGNDMHSAAYNPTTQKKGGKNGTIVKINSVTIASLPQDAALLGK